MSNIRVGFIGGLTNGKIVFDYLSKNKYVDLVFAITYKEDFNGARYARIESDKVSIQRTGSVKGCESIIRNSDPDLIIVVGWSELVPDEVFSIPSMGCIGFHPAKLPKDRGRSVLAWQIEDGYTETALTMFKYTDYPDGGDILAQEPIKIDETDYINDILDKIDKATLNIMRAYFPLIRQGLIKERRQDLSEGNFRRLRGAADSVIDWNQPQRDIYNKVRAISKPYPGATSTLNGGNIAVWRSEIVDAFPFGNESKPGTLVATLFDGSLLYKTRDSFIRITEYETL